MATTTSNVLSVVSIGALMGTLKYSGIVLIVEQRWQKVRWKNDERRYVYFRMLACSG